jgi:hypothetical protein
VKASSEQGEGGPEVKAPYLTITIITTNSITMIITSTLSPSLKMKAGSEQGEEESGDKAPYMADTTVTPLRHHCNDNDTFL